jgi:hypothetical protein
MNINLINSSPQQPVHFCPLLPDSPPITLNPPAPEYVDGLRLLVDQRGGDVPFACDVTFEVEIAENAAQVFFFKDREMIAVSAIAWFPGEESRSIWAWIHDAASEETGRRSKCLPPPKSPWTATAALPCGEVAPSNLLAIQAYAIQLAIMFTGWMSR